MRYGGLALKAFLAARLPFFQADLFTFTLASGQIYRWTTSDQQITAGPWTWVAVGPVLTRSGWQVKNTMSVPSMTLKLFSNGSDFGGLNIKQAIHNGLLDRAVVHLQRAIMPTFGDTSMGLVDIFQAQVSTVTLDALGAEITAKGANVVLQQYMPRNTYQLGCIHTLYDSGCKLARANYQEVHTLTNSDRVTLAWTDSAIDPALMANGVVEVLTGQAAGSKRTLASTSSASVAVSYPLLVAPAVGDTIRLTQGCARTLNRCSIFQNTANFRGFPFIPPVETAL